MTLSIREYDKVVRRFVDDYVDNLTPDQLREIVSEQSHIDFENTWQGETVLHEAFIDDNADVSIREVTLGGDPIEDFVIEVSEWGIYELGGVDFDTLTSNDIERLNQFQKNQSSEEAV